MIDKKILQLSLLLDRAQEFFGPCQCGPMECGQCDWKRAYASVIKEIVDEAPPVSGFYRRRTDG